MSQAQTAMVYAVAAHRRLGLPLIGAVTTGGVVRAVGARCPNGKVLQWPEIISVAEFFDRHGAAQLAFLSEDELLEGGAPPRSAAESPPRLLAKGLVKITVEQAERCGDALSALNFPADWGWEGGEEPPPPTDLTAFLAALHQICRSHGFYLREGAGGCLPIVYRAYGDEAGFLPERVIGGWTLQRVLQDGDAA